MDNFLRVTLYTDGDGTAELTAEVQNNGFSGRASAWFGLKQLNEYAEQLLTYPIGAEGLPVLQGGFYSRERKGELEETHVALRVYPVGMRGALGCHVALRMRADHDKANSVSVVEVELRTSYQELSVFSGELKRLIASQATVAVLKGVDI